MYLYINIFLIKGTMKFKITVFIFFLVSSKMFLVKKSTALQPFLLCQIANIIPLL